MFLRNAFSLHGTLLCSSHKVNTLELWRKLSTQFEVKNCQRRNNLNLFAAVIGGLVTSSGLYYYSLPASEKRFVRVTLGGVVRFFRSSFIGLAITWDYFWTPLGILETDPDYVDKLAVVHKRSALRILQGCLKNGGLYVKLGQGLVVMDHILPPEYIETMRTLQDKCLSRGSGELHEIMQEDFGKPLNEIFSKFNEDAIGAASLAQVFQATTKDGKEVAVKVQYIDLQDRFVGDVTTLQVLLTVAGWIHKDFDFSWVLKELKGTLEEELNFVKEGKNSERCAKDLSRFPFVHVPEVHWDLTSSRVLTAEFIDGTKISDKEKLQKAGFSLADIDYKLFQAFAQQIFHTGFVHADPHAGNILVRKSKKMKGAELVIIDHGLYEEVSDTIRESLRLLWKSMVLNDHKMMKECSIQLGVPDYKLLVEIITQVPQRGLNILTVQHLLTVHEEQLIKKARDNFNEIMNVLKSLPDCILLVIRNINTIRSIAKGHGDPIDRYKVMARIAAEGSFVKNTSNFVQRLKKYRELAHFEFYLWWNGVKIQLIGLYLTFYEVLYYI